MITTTSRSDESLDDPLDGAGCGCAGRRRTLRRAHTGSQCGSHGGGVGHRGQLDEPHLAFRCEVVSDLRGQTRLADTRRPDERDEPCSAQRLLDVGDVVDLVRRGR